jgi:DNA-binding Lrp family transcriptional regulator
MEENISKKLLKLQTFFINVIIKPDLSENKLDPITATANNRELYIDETDKQIVRALIESSRRSFSGVAKELGISTHKVINRYNKLREGKVVTRSAISVDLNKLGYKAMIHYFLKLEPKSKFVEIRQRLLEIPNTIVLIEHTGVYDIRIDMPVANIQDIFLANEQIDTIKGIEKVDYTINRCPKLFPWPLYTKIALIGQ